MRKGMTEVTEKTGIKHYPECGSTNIHSSVIYCPSIWECSDCSHEGAFIIEEIKPRQYQEERGRGYDTIDPSHRFPPENTNIPTDNSPKT
jgi:hypothetical protein